MRLVQYYNVPTVITNYLISVGAKLPCRCLKFKYYKNLLTSPIKVSDLYQMFAIVKTTNLQTLQCIVYS